VYRIGQQHSGRNKGPVYRRTPYLVFTYTQFSRDAYCTVLLLVLLTCTSIHYSHTHVYRILERVHRYFAICMHNSVGHALKKAIWSKIAGNSRSLRKETLMENLPKNHNSRIFVHELNAVFCEIQAGTHCSLGLFTFQA